MDPSPDVLLRVWCSELLRTGGTTIYQTKSSLWVVCRGLAMGRPNSSRLSLTSLHDAARKGDSRSLQRLIAIIDPTAADKVATVLQERDSRTPVTNSAAGTDPPLQGKKVLNACSSTVLKRRSAGTPSVIHVLTSFDFSNTSITCTRY